MGVEKLIKIQEIRILNPSSYILKFGRNDIQFQAGQYIGLGLTDYPYMRDYSIYSGEDDDFLEVLVREILEGDLSVKFKRCKVGQILRYDGPFGTFVLNKEEVYRKKYVFVASGTGIAPFHSMVKSYPNLNYKLLHGVKSIADAYDQELYGNNYILCTSKDSKGHFKGRVTDYFKKNPAEKDCLYYLCGNGNMIYEIFDILKDQGINENQVSLEVYFS